MLKGSGEYPLTGLQHQVLLESIGKTLLEIDYWTNQANTCFTFQQVFYFATLWIGILLVHSTFFYQSVL